MLTVKRLGRRKVIPANRPRRAGKSAFLRHVMNQTDVVIYHSPDCGTSRNTLAMIRNADIEPTVIAYLRHPPTREQLAEMISAAGLMAHPILINRPFVITALGTRLCRPSEVVLEILPQAQKGVFAKEDGELVVNEQGQRVV
jgi:arsenate reductase